MKSEQTYFGYRDASRFLGKPIGTLYSLVSRKEIPFYRLGRRNILFSIEELQNWLSQHKSTPLETEVNGSLSQRKNGLK